MTHRRKSRGRSLAVAGMAAAAVLLTACSDSGSDNRTQDSVPAGVDQSTLQARGPDAQSINDLFVPFFWIAVVIGVIVVGATVYAAIRFRAKGDDDRPVQVHGHTGLEIGWTVVPAVILAVMAVPTVATIFELAERPEGEVVEITVTGKQWWWQYEYENEGLVTANEMHIPAGEPVVLNITATDVIHSFWVPNLAGKKDAVPGRSHFLKIEADEPGEFLGQCAEYCGLSHANMRLRVIAHERSEYDAWVAGQLAPLSPDEVAFVEAGAEEGGIIQKYGCTACHSFDPTGEGAQVGPNLSHLASRQTFAGAIFDLTEDNLREWLPNAPVMKPMQTSDPQGDAPATPGIVPGMPAFPEMTDAEVDELVTFLLGLE